MDIEINGRTYRNAFVYLLGSREDCSADIYCHGWSAVEAPPRYHTVEAREDGGEIRYTWNDAARVSPEEYDRLMGPSFHGSVDIG
jgi:hypothetical protein